MLTKMKQDLATAKMNTVTFGDIIPKMASEPVEVEPEEEEEEDLTWQPSDTLKSTLKSLSLFEDPKAMGLDKKEIRDSYSNFDSWLKSEIYRIVSIEKGKEDDAVWGDLE